MRLFIDRLKSSKLEPKISTEATSTIVSFEKIPQIRITIEKETVSISIDGVSHTLVYLDLLNLADLLSNEQQKLPQVNIKEVIEQKVISFDNNPVPVMFAETESDLQTAFRDLPVTDGCQRVYHGTSWQGALSIGTHGLLSESPQTVRPILSDKPNVMAATLARNEWPGYPREDETGFGAIVVMDVPSEDLEDRGTRKDSAGKEETLFQPARELPVNMVENMKKEVNWSRFGGFTPGFVPPATIVGLIMVKQRGRVE